MEKQDILAELSEALTVRAERIRSRVAIEREGEVEDIEELDEPAILPTITSNPQTSQIPISRARLRRRENRINQQTRGKITTKQRAQAGPKKGSNVNIKHYRPGYTWNRGGRIKELRVRCLARKYLILWQKKTFGSLLLSDAQNHYDVSLLQKTFGAWHDYWWEIVKEWRLGVRAECHFRYKLWYRTFMAWRHYTHGRRIKATKNEAASSHNNTMILRTTWALWRQHIRDKHKMSKLVKQVEEARNIRVMREAWSMWQERHSVHLSRQEDLAMALQFWSYRIQAQHWLVWRAAFGKRKQQEQHFADAVVYHNSLLASQCLKAWRLYTANRRAKKSHTTFAVRVYEVNLRVRCFNHWFYSWHLRRSVRQHQLRISSLSQSFRKRWVLWRLRQYQEMAQEEKAKEALADQHYNGQLLRVGVSCFHLNVVHSHIKVMRNKLAVQLRINQVQRRAWGKWSEALEGQEELRLASHTALAREQYRTALSQKCLQALKVYALWRRQRKSQYVHAEAHYYLHTMPKCLFHMRIFVEQEKKCREMAQQATEFSRACILEHVFHKWQSSALQSRDHRMMERMAILHRESTMLQSAFTLWHGRARMVAVETERLWEAREHYLVSICRKAWTYWTAYIQMKTIRDVNKEKAVKHCHLTALKGRWGVWRQRLEAQRRDKAQWCKAYNHHSRKMLKVCVKEWKLQLVQGQRFRATAQDKFVACQGKALHAAFHGWKQVAKEEAVLRRKSIAAAVHHNRVLTRKVVEAWHIHANMRAFKRSEAARVLRAASAQLQQLKLSLYFKRWQKERDGALVEKEKEMKSLRHFSGNAQYKAFMAWKDYNHLCLRKKLLSRQGQWFHDVRVSAKCFFVWRAHLRDHQEEVACTGMALWHWGMGLQRKALREWRQYTEGRKQKKARYIQAASMWRDSLLKDGCSQWLATADSLHSLRSTMAARQQAHSTFHCFHIVQRCARHWKTWARVRAAHRSSVSQRNHALTLASSVRLASNVSAHPVLFQTYPSTAASLPAKVVRPKPTAASSSPVKSESQAGDTRHRVYLNTAPERRERPKRPSFLVDSLKRAGLYSDAMFSDPATGQDDSTPSLTDLKDHDLGDPRGHVLGDPRVHDPDSPGTGRFVPHSTRHMVHRKHDPDWFLSAEVMSGSSSTLGAGIEDGVVKPLILSNSDTTDPSGIRTGSASMSSHSPHMFTPSTQRSQFSGNPLLYSSPISERNMARERDPSTAAQSGRPMATSTVTNVGGGTDFDTGGLKANLFSGLSMENVPVVSGNLGSGAGVGPGVLPSRREEKFKSSTEMHSPDFQFPDQVGTDQKLHSRHEESKVILLKPEDFMKKPPFPPTVDSSETRGHSSKRTPRAYSRTEADQEEGAERKSSLAESSSNQDTRRESISHLYRHTPREGFSPRRAAPPGILHNKVSDSDGDVSPLNTARSRGTVTFASPKSPSPEEEIVNIRDRLRHFSQQKNRLRSLRHQHRQLSEWLQDQGSTSEAQDQDMDSAAHELNMLQLEIEELQGDVDSQRPICERLALRAQALAQELQQMPA